MQLTDRYSRILSLVSESVSKFYDLVDTISLISERVSKLYDLVCSYVVCMTVGKTERTHLKCLALPNRVPFLPLTVSCMWGLCLSHGSQVPKDKYVFNLLTYLMKFGSLVKKNKVRYLILSI